MIKFVDVTKSVRVNREQELLILNHINLEIGEGELVAITGKSGAGKTTLLNVIGLIDSFDSGAYYLNGEEIGHKKVNWYSNVRNKYIGYVMQNFSLIEEYTVYENVIMPLDFSGRKIRHGEKKMRVRDALEMVGMQDREKQNCMKLSGGEKQRVAIARAIVNNPSVILADEPTGSLDTQNSEIVFNILKGLNDEGKTVIIVTHDLELAGKCDRKIVISDGKIMC